MSYPGATRPPHAWDVLTTNFLATLWNYLASKWWGKKSHMQCIPVVPICFTHKWPYMRDDLTSVDRLYKRDPLLCGAILLGQKVARKCFYNITLGNYIYNYIVICPTQQDNFPHPSIHSAIPFPFPMSCAVCLSLREGRGSLSSANGGSILDPPELQGWYSDDNG